MKKAATLIAGALISGCTTAPPDYSRLTPAPPYAMQAPKKVVPPKAGDDLDEKHTELIQQYGDVAGRLRVLQARERTLQGK